MSPYTFLLFLFLCSIKAVAVETVHFDILLFGNKIGTMTVTHEQRANGIELYTLDTKSKARILWIDKENISHYEVVYKNGQLRSSAHSELENGKLKRWTNINWNGKQYEVDSYKGKRSFSEVPVCSVMTIYFHDMANAGKIFYEAEADFDNISRPEPGTIEFKSSDGTRNIYYFEKGKIKSMEFHISIATVKMVRTN